MSKRTSNSRQSISSAISIPASIDNVKTFEEYLSMATHQQETSPPPPPPKEPDPPKEPKRAARYSIIARNKAAVSKQPNNFVELNKQKVVATVELRERDRERERDRRPSTWRNLIKGVLDLQRGKIPLLLAVEAGNQSMVRELLSAQTAEQLQVSFEFTKFSFD